ncbi:Peptidase M28 domain-containing protein [Sphingomonas antarctica]|uniref:M20/M25/M40 family metallo-hydrolase n=1 Tax=Sphingomonas antarctica TaxID=2040274 RepID=UPI0039EAC79B
MRLVLALLGAVLLAIFATTPPGPRGSDTPATEFSAVRAMADVRAIARAPHPTGSAEDAHVRDVLTTRLRAIGLEVSTAQGSMDAKSAERLATWSGSTATVPLTNIIARLPGTDPTLPAVLLMAHHDTVWGSPGAADDSAGVVSILETVRALKASGPQRRDVIVLLTDGEELGLSGAKMFFAGDPLRAHIGPIVNLETRGGGGRASMFETGDGNDAAVRLFAGAVRRPVGTSLSVFVYKKLPNSTDFTPAKAAGHYGYNFAFVGRPGLYHSPLATPDNLDQGALQDMGGQVLDLTRALAAAPVDPVAKIDRVFFDIFGLFVVHYPPVFGWVLLGAAALAWGFAARGAGTWRDGVRGIAVTLLLPIVAGVLLYAINLVSGADGPVNYYDRLAAIPRLQVQALLACIASIGLVRALLMRHRLDPAGWTGAAVPLLLLAAVAQGLAPTAAFLITVPLLIGGVVALLSERGVLADSIAVVLAAIGIGHLLAIGFLLMQAVGPGMPMIAALPLVLAATIAWPLAPIVSRQTALTAALLLIVAALAVALWVRLDPVAASVAVYSKFGAPH